MKPAPPLFDPLLDRINATLARYDDESWHHSRLRLVTRPLEQIPGAKALWLETIATGNRDGQRLLRELRSRVSSAVGHLSELPIIQIVICRLNEALLALTTDEDWQHQRPFITWVRKDELVGRGMTTALWYEVEELLGDDTESA